MSQSLVSRRAVLLGAAGTAGVAALGGAWWALRPEEATAAPTRVASSSEAVRRAEQARRGRGTGRTVHASLTAEQGHADLGGRTVPTWSYGGNLPGQVIRCTAGDRLQVDVRNRLPKPTTVHWHGLRIRNDMDGVPHLTQPLIAAGDSMRYDFTVPDAGTYWFHPHVGLQRERGLYAPLIVDDPHERGAYDVEFLVVLDDWTDGVADSPDRILATLRKGGMKARYETRVQEGQIPDRSKQWQYHVTREVTDSPAGKMAKTMAQRMASSVDYPLYLLGGRLPSAPRTFRAKPGQRARIRLINAGGATVFRVALGGHRLTVTHTDGFPVEPVTVDTLQIASGERYDLLVTLDDGAFPLVAVAEGKQAQALGIVRTASGDAPDASVDVPELGGRLLDLSDLRATEAVRETAQEPDVTHTAYLTGDMMKFSWHVNAETYHHDKPFSGITPLVVRAGERVRLLLVNQTPMYHPMHLHGHTFTVRSVSDTSGKDEKSLSGAVRKDTLMVPPGERISVDFTADNPGQWLLHCHNAYHMATGMATVLSYVPQGSGARAAGS
ncbi:putative oxidase (copper-binding protein) [Streptomyces anthocyanicus]|uniref:multicopper oxidase family protein n=1 Tax=Streptomyces anthocyanicus TaxID=68174 RepID=UPI00166FF5EF|nr:multicopper oxidase family protein [Streptomyces anthocyanicus]GGL36083.1 putative oxidase (copper-binding protein) [Streptomyces anthocyanicus]